VTMKENHGISVNKITQSKHCSTHLLVQTLYQVANVPPHLLEELVLFLQARRPASQLHNRFTAHFSTRAHVVSLVCVDPMYRNHLRQPAQSVTDPLLSALILCLIRNDKLLWPHNVFLYSSDTTVKYLKLNYFCTKSNMIEGTGNVDQTLKLLLL